ncbi:ImmA/IrrE family metallo-endopeptidase [Clostridium cagae]|uniref:ImmA/IrrE family metallo-endopeptidase n=1 Tax=Clostridium cagae TaxID=2080751 RepID=UPI003F76EBF0
MTKYEKLLVKVEKLGIRVREIDFQTNEECGYYHNNKILINSRLTEKQKHGVLAEELGHHVKTYGDITDQSELKNRKQELIARREGYKFIIEPLDLVYAYCHGCKNIYEIAEFYDITEKQLNDIILDFKNKYGIGKKFDKYFVRFEPSFGFYEIFDDKYVF